RRASSANWSVHATVLSPHSTPASIRQQSAPSQCHSGKHTPINIPRYPPHSRGLCGMNLPIGTPYFASFPSFTSSTSLTSFPLHSPIPHALLAHSALRTPPHPPPRHPSRPRRNRLDQHGHRGHHVRRPPSQQRPIHRRRQHQLQSLPGLRLLRRRPPNRLGHPGLPILR